MSQKQNVNTLMVTNPVEHYTVVIVISQLSFQAVRVK